LPLTGKTIPIEEAIGWMARSESLQKLAGAGIRPVDAQFLADLHSRAA
jgi:hypothetical protein